MKDFFKSIKDKFYFWIKIILFFIMVIVTIFGFLFWVRYGVEPQGVLGILINSIIECIFLYVIVAIFNQLGE